VDETHAPQRCVRRPRRRQAGKQGERFEADESVNGAIGRVWHPFSRPLDGPEMRRFECRLAIFWPKFDDETAGLR
jgi:hypothetical protein